MPSNIRLLALDLDGTVLDSEKRISPGNFQAIRDAIAAGVTVVPASGRAVTGMTREFLDLPGVDYALGLNGASVIRLADGLLIHGDYLEDAVALELMERFAPLTLVAAFFLADQGYVSTRQAPLMDRLTASPALLEYIKSSRIAVEDPLKLIREKGNVQKITLHFPHLADGSWSDKDKVNAILKEHPELSAVSGGTDNLEITSGTANKGAGLLALAKFLDIPREQIMAMGDSENDIAMLDAAGFSVCMGNSEIPVFAHADAVTSTNDADGVAKAIYKYVL